MASTFKVCARCKKRKSKTEFNNDRRRRDGLAVYCRACSRASSKAQYVRHKTKRQAAHRKRTYGLEDGEYERILEVQGGKCALQPCRARGLSRALAVDHDHATGRVRGLLCSRDNVRLGWFESKAASIADYLANPPADKV